MLAVTESGMSEEARVRQPDRLETPDIRAPRPRPDLYIWRGGVESLSWAKLPCHGLYGEQW